MISTGQIRVVREFPLWEGGCEIPLLENKNLVHDCGQHMEEHDSA